MPLVYLPSIIQKLNRNSYFSCVSKIQGQRYANLNTQAAFKWYMKGIFEMNVLWLNFWSVTQERHFALGSGPNSTENAWNFEVPAASLAPGGDPGSQYRLPLNDATDPRLKVEKQD